MSKTTIVISDQILGLHKADPRKTDHLITSIWYEKGGTSMFSGQNQPRGYYLSVRVEGIEVTKYGEVRSFELFTGGHKHLIQPAKMFSAKKLEAVAADPDWRPLAEEMESFERTEWEAKN